MSKKVRIGIVGGGFARAFSFHEHPDSVVTAIAELDEERRAAVQEQVQAPAAYASLDELVKDPNVDAVALFTPAPLHARHSITALKAGKHVMCAVPAAFSLEECHELIETVRSTGLTYMMAETSWYRRETIQARDWYNEGRFGELFYTEAEYWHERLDSIMYYKGQRTWRYGLPPMHYPTHSTGFLVGVTGERLVSVQCIGWGDDDPILKDNVYNNPFWNEVGLFKTDRGHPARIIVGWHLSHPEVERATWFGRDFTYIMGSPTLQPAVTCRSLEVTPAPPRDFYERLPEPLRHDSGHGGSHTYLTDEFVSAVRHQRRPSVDVYESVACTAPGIVAHQSALRDGEVMAIPDFGRWPG